MATKLIALLRKAIFEPFLTGPLLYVLLKGPADVRESLLKTLHITQVSKFTTAVKVLFALGVLSRTNRALTAWANNNFTLGRRGEPFRWDGRTEIVLITGGCSGFGKLMAQDFSTKAQVVVLDVSPLPEDLKRLSNIHYYQCDVTNSDQIASVCAKVRAEVGNPSVLMNNAGIGVPCNIMDATPEFLVKIFRINLICHYQFIQEFLPAMLEQRKGHIVTVASMASFVAVPSISAYCATKAGALAFHETLNLELRQRYTNGECIQTTVVHPSWARTGIIAGAEAQLEANKQNIMDPTVVTNQIVKQVLKGKSGQLIIPKALAGASGIRGWPTWLQDGLRSLGKDKTAIKQTLPRKTAGA